MQGTDKFAGAMVTRGQALRTQRFGRAAVVAAAVLGLLAGSGHAADGAPAEGAPAAVVAPEAAAAVAQPGTPDLCGPAEQRAASLAAEAARLSAAAATAEAQAAAAAATAETQRQDTLRRLAESEQALADRRQQMEAATAAAASAAKAQADRIGALEAMVAERDTALAGKNGEVERLTGQIADALHSAETAVRAAAERVADLESRLAAREEAAAATGRDAAALTQQLAAMTATAQALRRSLETPGFGAMLAAYDTAAAGAPGADAYANAGPERRAALQTALKALGHYRGAADGRFGSGTGNAIKDYQAMLGVPATGTVTVAQDALLTLLATRLDQVLAIPAVSPRGRPAATVTTAAARMTEGERWTGSEPREAAYWFAAAAGMGEARGLSSLAKLWLDQETSAGGTDFFTLAVVSHAGGLRAPDLMCRFAHRLQDPALGEPAAAIGRRWSKVAEGRAGKPCGEALGG